MTKTTSLTKAQLITELSTLRAYCERIEAELASVKAEKPARPAKPAYVPAPPSPEQLARRAAMVAAREAAMSGKRVVTVQFA